MATAAHRARDRGASGDGRRQSESGRDRGAAAGRMGTATAGKTGQRERGDHRVGRDKTDPNDQPQPQPRKPESGTPIWSGLRFGDDGHGTTLEEGEDKRAIYLQAAIVVDEAFLLEPIHKFAYPCACGTNHLR
jgi:hypothetical protein